MTIKNPKTYSYLILRLFRYTNIYLKNFKKILLKTYFKHFKFLLFLHKKIKIENTIILLLIFNISFFFTGIIIFIQMQYFGLESYEENSVKISDYPYYINSEVFQIGAKSVVVYETDSRVFVYKKNENFRFSPASAAKIMTAIITLENYDLEGVIEARGLEDMEGSKMGLLEGERIKIIDLLYGLLLSSGNDAANILSNHIKGGNAEFVKKMNEKGSEVKLFNTHFADASGLSDENFTTAYDLARLASIALENEIFSDIVKTKYKTVFDETQNIRHSLTNLNELLGESGVMGIKTGFTNEAGEVLITSIRHREKVFIIVVLKSENRFADTRKIISDVVKKTDILYL